MAILVVPLASAQEPQECGQPGPITALAGDQRVELTWSPVTELCLGEQRSPVVAYDVHVFERGALLTNQTKAEPAATLSLNNDRSYAFVVYALDAQGNRGPGSPPVGATPRFERDLQYLAAGLIVTWVGLFAYAAILARKEDRLLRRLEQLLNRDLGRNPP